jgi:ribosomal protein L40E
MNNQSIKIEVGTQPIDIAIDASSKYAYVANYESCNITVLDVASDTVVGTVDLTYFEKYHPLAIATDTKRNYAYVTAELSNHSSDCVIFIINMNTRSISGMINREIYDSGEGNVRSIAVTYYNNNPYLFITHYYDNHLVIYDLNTFNKLGTWVELNHNYTVGQTYPVLYTSDMAFSPDGSLMYVAHKRNVSVFQTSKLIAYCQTNTGYIAEKSISTSGSLDEVYRLQPDPSGSNIFLSCYPNDIAIYDSQLSYMKADVPVGIKPTGMAIDNNTLYVCNSNDCISAVDTVNQVEVARTIAGAIPCSIAIFSTDVPISSPTPTPTPLPVPKINVSVDPNPLVAGSDAQIKIVVTNDTTPVKNANIRVTTTGGTVRSPTGVATSDGVYITNFTSSSAGRFDITVYSNASGYQDQTSSAVITVSPLGVKVMTMNVTIEPKQVFVSSEAAVTVKIIDGSNQVSDATVNFISTGGKVTRLIPTTASDGTCYAKFTANSTGSFVITVTATKTGYQSATANAVVSVMPAPVNMLTMNVTVMPEPIVLGSEAVISVTVFNGTTPVNGAQVDLSSAYGAITPLSGQTTSDGKFLARFKPSGIGYGFLTVTANLSGYQKATSSTAINVTSPPPKKLYTNMSIDSKSVDVNTGATVTLSVTDGLKPLSDVGINITCTGGNIVPAYGKTDSDGKFNAKFLPDGAGTYTITAMAVAGGYEQASSSAMVDAVKNLDLSEYIFWIVLVIIIVAALIIGTIWFLRRWLRKSLVIVPKKTRIPADGTTRVPIRVQFMNGFGMPKKMGSDLDVEFESTAGKIKNVTLPSRRAYVDTERTSSAEFGRVTITAKSGRDIATAEVEFVIDNGSLEVTISPDSIPADGKSSATITIKIKDAKSNYIKPLEDTVVEFNTSLGDTASSVYMAAGSLSANATIFSGDMTGLAMITASMGNIRGEGKIEFRGLPKRFCMNCGMPMTLDASSCPSCNKIPPSGVDTKQCMTCGTVIPEQAQFCHKCGAMQSVRDKAYAGGLN